MTKHLPKRKHPAHGILRLDGQPRVIFDAVCTKSAKPWLACNEVHKLLCDTWRKATGWLMGRYVILPDHLHFFAFDEKNDTNYDNWVTYWKSQFSRRYGKPKCRWLTDHWDRRIRNQDVYEDKWEYIRWNPVRHGLVENPEDWPFQGEIHKTIWI